LNYLQKNLPLLGDYIFGIDDFFNQLDDLMYFTGGLVSEFYSNQVVNITMNDLVNSGSLSKDFGALPTFYTPMIYQSEDEFFDFVKAIERVKDTASIDHPCKNAVLAKLCNIQTDKIIAKNLDKFFKIMLLTSVLYTKSNYDVIRQFVNMKAFREQFKVINITVNSQPLWPFINCGFRKTLKEVEDIKNCTLMTTTLTPFGICSSFNAFSHQQVYVDTDHSESWTTVIKEDIETSKLRMIHITSKNFSHKEPFTDLTMASCCGLKRKFIIKMLHYNPVITQHK